MTLEFVIRCDSDFINILNYSKENQCRITFSSIYANSDNYLFATNNADVEQKRHHIHCINKMNRIIEINTDGNYAIVEGGVSWLELIQELDIYNYTICSAQSGITFSIAGSICVNAHGRNTKTPMIYDTILSIEFIDGNGNRRETKWGEPLFNMLVGSMGLLGFITRVKLKIMQIYPFRQEFHTLRYDTNIFDKLDVFFGDPDIYMINVRFGRIDREPKEVLVNLHRICNSIENIHRVKPNKYKQDYSMFYTLCVVLISILCKFSCFDLFRWKLEKKYLHSLVETACDNVNNTYEIWSRPHLKNFKIVEFFFPRQYFIYCQTMIFHIFEKNGVSILSSGSRIIFENRNIEGIRFSIFSSKREPYISLVLNCFICDGSHQMKKITDDIRKYIIYKNIRTTYHTAYSWDFSRSDILFMFPHIPLFEKYKQTYDPENIFTNRFYENYIRNSSFMSSYDDDTTAAVALPNI